MKLKVLLSASCLSIAASSLAHESGFYTAAGAVFSQFDARLRAEGVSGTDTASSHFNEQTTQATGRLFAGYQQALHDHSFAAAELFFTPHDSVKKFDFDLHDPDSTNRTQIGSLKLSRDYTVGLNLKYGRYFDSKTAAFIGLGFLGSQFTTTFRDVTQSTSDRNSVFGVSPTVGIMHHIKPRLPVSLSYAYDIYKTFKTKNIDMTGADDSLRITSKNRYHTFMLSVSCML
ncbi:MAG: hypothetical protein A2621_04620 [Alphaproteobacteria bacterium RIFCSPHIGHO2_01_FULL_41_14]|nr:MAG: hypothetical protein A2065_00170 [Alphaproteobacteria bacterium GWB1_45_5]OFW76097.1 MAG: hypothetical protein A3K20_03120 [Alphaproteobacteria bacterium GWA1_45_9]OFW90245.1 MAG: hypothetical protein A2621_04620 [Alphaproteobacteria bacterium RIFCSPHIGHO2_01_FULL_41_14]HCI48292.1 hypothetical protein [Holosporales bacterium]